MSHRLVVVGASLAGLRAVQAARAAGHAGPITLVGAEEHLPYDRPPLSKSFLDVAPEPRVTFKEEQHLRGDLGVDLRLGTPATALDTAARVVTAGGQPVPYDALVIATGATARRLPGTDGIRGVHTLRTLDDAIAVRSALDAGARTVIIGAGFIGSEVASAARKRDLPVSIVEAAAVPLVHAVGADVGRAIAELHRQAGTDLRCGTTVDRIESRDGQVRAVHLSDGSAVDADLVVVGIGATPATEWLAGSGIRLNDGVVCDESLAVHGVRDVYAAGDVARWHNALFDKVMRIEHWTAAADQGAVAAHNAINSGPAKKYAAVPYFWSDWYGHRLQFVGIPGTDEVRIVGDRDRFVALYRQGERLVGTFALNGQSLIMKYRALIADRASWDAALAFCGGSGIIQPC